MNAIPTKMFERPHREPLESRFWSRVETRADGCWIWTGHGNRYGMFNIAGKRFYAHRVSWELHNGPIPDGLHTLHRCDVPRCVRPDHLFLGTQKDNIRDCTEKGRKTPPPHYHGEGNGRAKLTEDDVREIRRLRATGIGPVALAKQFGMTMRQIQNIVLGLNWKHVK